MLVADVLWKLEQTITSVFRQLKFIRRRFAIQIKPLLCDITNSSFWYHKSYFVTSTNNLWFCDIAILILWYENWFCSFKKSNLWHHIFDFMISHKSFLDITKSLWFFLYHKLEFVISRNWFCVIKNWFCDIKNHYDFSGGSRGGSGGSNEPPLEPKLFHFHGEFQKKWSKCTNRTPLS